MSKFEFLSAYVCFDEMYVTFYLRPMQLLNIRRHCGQINEVMKLPFFLKPRQLCHIHTDICIYQRSYVVCSNTSLTFLPLEKNAIFRKGRNFHIFYSPHEMIKPVRCNQPYPSHLHIVIYTIIIRKIGLFFDIRKHVLKVYSLLKANFFLGVKAKGNR